MDVDSRALRLGVAVAVVGTVPKVAVVVALYVLDVPVEPTGLSVFASWSWDAVAHWAADTVTGGMLLVAPLAALYAAFPEDRDPAPVVAGFTAAALVFGVGLTAAEVLPALLFPFPPAPPAEYVRMGVGRALRFGVLAALGAFAGDAGGSVFRAPEGADGEEGHPRW
jgi:hypothetical protein